MKLILSDAAGEEGREANFETYTYFFRSDASVLLRDFTSTGFQHSFSLARR